MLQTRSAKRTAPAAVKIAVDMVDEGILSKEEALRRVEPGADRAAAPAALRRGRQGPKAQDRFLAKGLNASPGAATGKAIFDPDRAVEAKAAGDPVILVRIETRPDDVHGMLAARGVLTARGGATSHAAVVARSMGLPCVAGAETLQIDYAKREMRAGDVTGRRGRHDQHRRHHRRDLRRRRCRPSRRASRTSTTWPRCSAGRTRCAACRSGPTRTTRGTRSAHARSARRASACAARSTCSSRRTGCRPCGA